MRRRNRCPATPSRTPANAKRGKPFTKLIKDLTVAARMGGGEPANNPRLRKAIADAKKESMPGDTIKNAVKRGTGEIEGAAYEEILYRSEEHTSELQSR